jgi:hypothetical protein
MSIKVILLTLFSPSAPRLFLGCVYIVCLLVIFFRSNFSVAGDTVMSVDRCIQYSVSLCSFRQIPSKVAETYQVMPSQTLPNQDKLGDFVANLF